MTAHKLNSRSIHLRTNRRHFLDVKGDQAQIHSRLEENKDDQQQFSRSNMLKSGIRWIQHS